MTDQLDLEAIKARLAKRRAPQIGHCQVCGAEQEMARFGAVMPMAHPTPFDFMSCSTCGQPLVVTFTITTNGDEPSADDDIESILATIATLHAIVEQWRARVIVCRQISAQRAAMNESILAQSWHERAEYVEDCADELEELLSPMIERP